MKKIKQLGLRRKPLLVIGAVVAAGLVLAAGTYGYLYISTPAHIRHPQFEHYHFRTQLIVDGQPVDFSSGEFQQEYDASNCSIEVGGHPIDFHDRNKQMAHVHWDGMRGGEFLKYFGWNMIGGSDNSLGQRYDSGMMRMHRVGIYGGSLPDIPRGANFYIYTGDENGYEQKSWDDFLNQDLEDFFGKQSSVNSSGQTSFSPGSWLLPKVSAHGGVMDEHEREETGKNQEELARINNLIGNVVIFVQANEPSDEQIKARFANLVPLDDSVCGG
jgi:hypothetical protein